MNEDLKFTNAGDYMSNIVNQRKSIKSALRSGIATVIFEKKDGTRRTLKGTNNFSLIPDEHQPKSEKQINVSDEVHRVFDTEINEWRSFRWDSVLTYYVN